MTNVPDASPLCGTPIEKMPSEFAAHGEIAGVHVGAGDTVGEGLAEGQGLALGFNTPA
jgi:hypothetical protein